MILETFTGVIEEAVEFERNGVPVGRVSGLLTTFVPSRPFESRRLPARFERTAFDATIQTHKDRGRNGVGRPIRLKNEHDVLIGGFPIELVSVNSQGLAVVGEINLETQQGAESFSLAKQGVLTDFSMGYTVTESHDENGSLIADSVQVFEGSMVEEPANQGARADAVEALTSRELEKIIMSTERCTRAVARIIADKILEHEEDAEKQVESDLLKAMEAWFSADEKDSEIKALQVIISQMRGESL